MGILKDVASLFFPPTCAACGRELKGEDDFLCPYCRWEIPLTRFWEREDNPLAERLREQLPVERAAAFFFFAHDSNLRTLIHNFKYRRQWAAARKMGEWFGGEAREYYRDIDVIIPVPLHPLRRMKRGYNQSEYIAQGIARALGKPVDTRSVRRTKHTRPQALHTGIDRWANVENIFRARRPETLKGKHILLVDDVLTTGATILSLAATILRAAPDARISIAAIAATRNSPGE